jgi:hypothetical protein
MAINCFNLSRGSYILQSTFLNLVLVHEISCCTAIYQDARSLQLFPHAKLYLKGNSIRLFSFYRDS